MHANDSFGTFSDRQYTTMIACVKYIQIPIHSNANILYNSINFDPKAWPRNWCICKRHIYLIDNSFYLQRCYLHSTSKKISTPLKPVYQTKLFLSHLLIYKPACWTKTNYVGRILEKYIFLPNQFLMEICVRLKNRHRIHFQKFSFDNEIY